MLFIITLNKLVAFSIMLSSDKNFFLEEINIFSSNKSNISSLGIS